MQRWTSIAESADKLEGADGNSYDPACDVQQEQEVMARKSKNLGW
jgi:hypothetical protein